MEVVKQDSMKKNKAYLKEMKDEIRRISWTSKEELKKSTKIVVGATFFLGFTIYIIDLFIRNGLQGLSSVVHRLIG